MAVCCLFLHFFYLKAIRSHWSSSTISTLKLLGCGFDTQPSHTEHLKKKRYPVDQPMIPERDAAAAHRQSLWLECCAFVSTLSLLQGHRGRRTTHSDCKSEEISGKDTFGFIGCSELDGVSHGFNVGQSLSCSSGTSRDFTLPVLLYGDMNGRGCRLQSGLKGGKHVSLTFKTHQGENKKHRASSMRAKWTRQMN